MNHLNFGNRALLYLYWRWDGFGNLDGAGTDRALGFEAGLNRFDYLLSFGREEYRRLWRMA